MGVNGTPQDLHFLLAKVYPIVGAPRLKPCDELGRLMFFEITGLQSQLNDASPIKVGDKLTSALVGIP